MFWHDHEVTDKHDWYCDLFSHAFLNSMRGTNWHEHTDMNFENFICVDKMDTEHTVGPFLHVGGIFTVSDGIFHLY